MLRDRYRQRAVDYHGLRYRYHQLPADIDLDSNIEIICPAHGRFTVTAGDHLRGSRCPECCEDIRASTI